MKKLLLTTFTIFAVALTACSSAAMGIPAETTSNALPMETQIAVGTLKLAGTDQDITSEQAEELAVLWQVYEELGQSDTAAQEEVDAVTAQIQETMTADQMQAITDMQVTQQDVFTAMQGGTVSSSSSSSNTVSVSSGGSMPAGSPPSDGGGMPPDGGIPADMGGGAPISSTDQSTQGSSQSITQVPSALVEAVIQSLQQKIAVSLFQSIS